MALVAEGRAMIRAVGLTLAMLPGFRRDRYGPVPSRGGVTDGANALRIIHARQRTTVVAISDCEDARSEADNRRI